MNRIGQGLTLVLLGAAALTSTIPTDLYLNWVKPAFGPFLIGAGVVMVVLGVLVVAAELRGEGEEVDQAEAEPRGARTAAAAEPRADDAAAVAEQYGHGGGHGHDHSRAPGIAWMLLLPVLAVFVVAPPALGAYTVETSAESAAPPRDSARAGRFDDGLEEAGPGEVVAMDIQAFIMRAWIDEDRALAGREVELTGFAVPDPEGEGWYLARLQMACCAADAVVNKVFIDDGDIPEADSWWTVRGTWVEPQGPLDEVTQHEVDVIERAAVENPPDPYE
ncbi:putative repeat protein (TIGR03943 family) [Nocardiopsis sp. Huas11]|uniref:TIGR03943 family putative permease subunit n=1 Tax=Nocardiopsis sp. Huas11 TaxID=2183912 RepID=UPI000EAD98BE|nr:TIGR03943 family protein [Nocardiopsis sp. Huas11]RKS07966.1 putative repeat protein (TIGR03943 family) [Nocardiopsis sp. Huas11]